ncbi:MAG: hypothetical protein FWE85_04875 [Clostridiales bacterium]|nr:hypothetical protein [Clostridiales bacterium]
MSVWQEPKTDWQAEDFFRRDDYRRITGNMLWIAQEAANYYNKTVSLTPMAEVSAATLCRPALLNAVEKNAGLLAERFWPEAALTTRLFAGGEAFWDHADLNRLEQFLLQTRRRLEQHYLCLPHLGTFYLGGSGA